MAALLALASLALVPHPTLRPAVSVRGAARRVRVAPDVLASAAAGGPTPNTSPPPPPGSTAGLYSLIEVSLRACRREGADDFSARTARGLSQRWTTLPPSDLVEAVFVAGALVLRGGFDEGLAVLLEAEDVAGLALSGRAYAALCRLALAEERPADALTLLARARAAGVELSDGLLLGAMEAAASLEDWGAVARLHTELSEGPEAAAAAALELELYASPTIVEDLLGADAARGARRAAAEGERSPHAQALALALRAHCERRDVGRAVELVERLRARTGAALAPSDYARLASLASTTGRPAPLLALRPADLQRSASALVEPRLFALSNRIGVAGASLGVVERALVAGAALLGALGAFALLTGGVEGSLYSAKTATLLADTNDLLGGF